MPAVWMSRMTDISDIERRERYLAQTNEQFAALDRYVQEFELVWLHPPPLDNGAAYAKRIERSVATINFPV